MNRVTGSKKKLCVVTGTRAEYGLLSGLMHLIDNSDNMELQLIVTGMHLAPEFGLTYQAIEEDGFHISRKVEMLLSSDSDVGITKSIGLSMTGYADAFAELKPDLVILLGDRFEIFAAAAASTVAKLPIAHIHGGETTEGAFDEPFRHSITKMSHFHFASTETYRRRVIQLGEHPDRVFNVGALGLDFIDQLKLLSLTDFQASIDFELGVKNLLVTFHPVTLEHDTARLQFIEVLDAVDQTDAKLIFTKANADTGGRIINTMIEDYVATHRDKAVVFTSLGQMRYLSALQYIDGVVGNSSSGIIEAPSFNIGTINIGDRQRGRIKADSVIDCEPTSKDILLGLDKLYSEEFQSMLKTVENPYGCGGAATKIMAKLSDDYDEDMIKKSFYDINYFHDMNY